MNTETIINLLVYKSLLGITNKSKGSHVIDTFGEIYNHQPQVRNSYEIYSYNDLQFFLIDEYVKGFSYDYQRFDKSNSAIRYDPISENHILNCLYNLSISYENIDYLKTENGYTLKTSNDINFGFLNHNLISFGLLYNK